MRKVAHYMGMPISIDIPQCNDIEIFENCWNICESIDNRYSPYKKSSEVSKLADGRISTSQVGPELKKILKLATEFEKSTDGYFSVYYNSSLNTNGIVKAWAIKKIEDSLIKQGYNNFLINAGGDIVCKGVNIKWKIAIRNPNINNKFLGTITADSTAVATSGSYEKGLHIYNPKNNKPTSQLKSVTVIGPDIITADVYATALYAMGYNAISYAKKITSLKSIIVDNNNFMYCV